MVPNPRLPGTTMPCGAILGKSHTSKSGAISVRPHTTVCRTPVKIGLRALLEREDFVYAVINEDLRQPDSFRHTACFANFCAQYPEVAAQRGLIIFGLYVDYFKMFEHARDATKGQVETVYLRPVNLPPAMANKPEC